MELQGTGKYAKHSSYQNLDTLGKYMLIRNKKSIEKSLQWAVSKNYVSYVSGDHTKNLANEYWIDTQRIQHDIDVVKGDKPYKEWNKKNQLKWAKRIVVQNGTKKDLDDISQNMCKPDNMTKNDELNK